jgi:hypothetical protein
MFMRGWLLADDSHVFIAIEAGSDDLADRTRVTVRSYRRYLPSPKLLSSRGWYRRLVKIVGTVSLILLTSLMVSFHAVDNSIGLYVVIPVFTLVTVLFSVFSLAADPEEQRLNYEGSVQEEAFDLSGSILQYVHAEADERLPPFEFTASVAAVQYLLDRDEVGPRHDFLRFVLGHL